MRAFFGMVSYTTFIVVLAIVVFLHPQEEPKSESTNDGVFIASVYTTDSQGNNERLFKSGDDVHISVVLKNTTNDVKRCPEPRVSVDGFPCSQGGEVELGPGETKVLKYHWSSRGKTSWKSSGFNFEGKSFAVDVLFGTDYKRWKFFVDEYGVPEWLRKGNGIYVHSLFEKKWNKPDEYERAFRLIKQAGFNSVFLSASYYNWGVYEGKTAKPFNYWFPTGPIEGEYHFTTPPDFLDEKGVFKQGKTEEWKKELSRRREIVKNFIKAAHRHGLKVVVYMDFMGIYDPIGIVSTLLDRNTKAHHRANELGYARFGKDNNPKRVNFPEKILTIPTGVQNFAVAPCFNGSSPLGMANEERGFLPSSVDATISKEENWDDPSWHFHIVKQVRWLVQNYDVDAIFVDDIGRLKMGPAEYLTGSITGQSPSDPLNSLGLCYCKNCEELRGDSDPNQFAFDSLSNMLRHIRWQIKEGHPDKALICSDYYIPWPSLASVEDATSTDQFDLFGNNFAEYARSTFESSFKPIRQDWNPRTHTLGGGVGKSPVLGAALAWANRNFFWFSADEIWENQSADIAKEITRYVQFYNQNSALYTDPCLELIYHSALPKDGRRPAILQPTGSGHFVLYTIPSKEGEGKRILHIIDTSIRLAPLNYSFLMKLPPGQTVQSIIYRSPDSENIRQDINIPFERCNAEGGPDKKGEFIRFQVNSVRRYGVCEIIFTSMKAPLLSNHHFFIFTSY